MSNISKIQSIESKYNFSQVTYKGAQLWPFVRIYSFYATLGIDKVKPERKVISNALKNLSYGFFNLFHKTDLIIFSNTEQRKLINGKFYDKFDFIDSKYRTLFFELTTTKFYHRKAIPTKHIVSKIPLYAISKIFKPFVSLKKIKQKEVLDHFLKAENINININALLKDYIAQYKLGKLLFFLYKPKGLILITAYTNYPYIQAFKEKGVKIIEFQHGLINKNHIGYNYTLESDKILFPDYLFTFGKNELTVFQNNNNYININRVKPVGHFYIDNIKNNFKKNEELSNLLNKYKISIAVSLQKKIEEKLLGFITNIAENNPNIAFVIVPRDKEKKYEFKHNNMFTFNSLNCYDIILHCDCHTTIYSSCAVESLGLGKPNILINIENQSENNLSFLLKNEEVNFLVNSQEDFSLALEQIKLIDNQKLMQQSEQYFKSNYVKNVNFEFNQLFIS